VADEVVAADALYPKSLANTLARVEIVFSCVGASVLPNWGDRRPYSAVDTPANLNLLEQARASHVRRFVYVSVCHPPQMASLNYIRAHAEVEKALEASGLDHAILRPTGFFGALATLVEMARKGPLPVLGAGEARSNPIHEEDLAEFCAAAIEGGPRVQEVGGPQVLTRRQMSEAAFEALGRAAAFRSAPLSVARLAGTLLLPFNPRLGHLVRFVVEVSARDVIAPCLGTQRLADYFKQVARA
jgi:uncharacterized protein YbjT (DUF2867 family)